MAKNISNELKIRLEMYFYGFYQIPGDILKIYKIGRFLAEKLSFSAFFVYIWGKVTQNGYLNGHKMAKNAPNELKFGPDMYFHEFYQIL